MIENKISIIINGKKIKAEEDQTILDAAKKNKIDIPSLCFHSDLDIKAGCRLCLVEIKNKKGLYTACSTKIEQGMEILTETPDIQKARKINLELLFTQHCEECDDCIFGSDCKLQELAKKYNVQTTRFSDRKSGYPVYQFGNSLVFDSQKCIDCRNCVDVCHKQAVDFLEIKENKSFQEVFPSDKPEIDCIYCGQCIVHCPVGAFEAVGEFEEVEKPLEDKDKLVIFQFAPAIRTTLGEEFNLPAGEIVTEKIVAAIKKLGAFKVFDTSVGADFTTTEEAKELTEKKERPFPVLSSCCPAWVKFIEFYYPEFIPNLATARSPHIILGGLLKGYYAEKEKIDPEKIVVVSIMPCVAKKYEIIRDELRVNNLKPVDYVLTTRELAFLLKKKKIDFKKIKPEKIDNPFGIPSGAGVIYGASGGVMESALRNAYETVSGRKLKNLDFKQVRGQQGIKVASLDFAGQKIKVAAVNGIGNAKKILEEVKKQPGLYHCIEVMACFGGCIGGGGQPVPADSETRLKRAEPLYKIDKKMKFRTANQNPVVKEVYKNFLNTPEKIQFFCHTKYSQKQKEN